MPRAISHEEKVNYMRISAGIAGMGFSNKHLDLLVCLYELVTEKRGDSNLMDVCKLEALVEQREAERIKEKK